MSFNPWLNSDDLIATIKRKISFPIYQTTFSDEDILAFCNDEVRDTMIPNILQYHEEFFVMSSSLPLELNKSAYAIPNRSIGMKLRDLNYGDNNFTAALPYGNLYELTRVSASDKAWFESAGVSNQVPYKFYLEGNNVIIVPTVTSNPIGVLVFYFYMRPNQIVPISRSFTISNFSKTITIDNTAVVAGDTVTLTVYNSSTSSTSTVFEAVIAAPTGNQFVIGATSTTTATNLTTAINNANIGFSANNGSPSTNSIKLTYPLRRNTVATSNSAGFAIQATLGFETTGSIPSNITVASKVDLLQTLPGHKTINYDIIVPTGGVSGSTISLNESDVPNGIIVGDYICSANECTIPQIPTELHSSLAQRVAARILEAIGDKEGLAVANAKIGELNTKESNVINNRVDGAPQKVLARHSILRYNGFIGRRRY